MKEYDCKGFDIKEEKDKKETAKTIKTSLMLVNLEENY